MTHTANAALADSPEANVTIRPDGDAPEDAASSEPEGALIEEVSIDGLCGVY